MERGCEFFDTSEFIKSSDLDGIHFGQEERRKLGEAVAQKIGTIVRRLNTFTAVQEQVESVNVYYEGIPDIRNWLGKQLIFT